MKNLTRGWEAVPILASLATVLIGLTALAGWALGFPVLAEWMPGMGEVNVDAALALVLCGCGLAALRMGRRNIVWLCGAAAAALGSFDLVRYLTAREPFSAAVLLGEPGLKSWLAASGHMAPASALAFLFASGTLLSGSGAVPQRHKTHVYLVLACAVIGVAALGRLEAVSGLAAGNESADFSGMATGTAAGLAALGTGLLGFGIKRRAPGTRAGTSPAAAETQRREDRSIRRLMMLQSVATGMLIALLGILAISQVQLHNANAAARRGLETVTRLQRTGIALEYEGREAKAAATGGTAADLLKDEIGAALAACQAVMEPGGGALRKLLAENASLAASLGNRCMTLSAAEARRAAEGFRFETVAALPDLHTLEDALQHGINLRMQTVLEAAPNRRAHEASARQWQATVLVACLIAGLGASVLQLGLLHQLSHEHSALAAEMVRRMEAEAQSRAYLEVAPAAILGIDRTGRIALVNSRALSAFGFASAELLGQTVEILAPERDRSRQGDLFRRYVRETGEPRGVAELELTARRKDGGEFPAEVRVSAIDSTAGKLVLVSVTDISQHKKSEEELRRAVRELESFAHSVSHDLRRPLQIIVGFSELLEANHAQALGNDGQEHIQRILSAGVHMSELIESLLSLAKVSTGPLSRTRVTLGDVANLVVEDLQCSEPGRTVTITTQPGLEVEGDPRLLRILLENLLGNAWKFTGKTAAAEIELGAQRHHGATVYFVKDNGAGFDMKKADDLFKAFHRLHEAGDFPGSGIGLATVQRIVHRHGGRIWAKSEPNRGATFCFTLEPVSDQQFKTVAA